MNHKFNVSTDDIDICSICNHSATDHGPYAVCAVCGKARECNLIDDVLTCSFCENWRNTATQSELEQHKSIMQVKDKFRQIDDGIKIQTDIFNAKTIAIHELKVAIDADPAIPTEGKNFALAQSVEKRFNHLRDIIFSKRQEISEAENEQKAIQIYYNELAKRLRTEEREKIRLKDAQYKPVEVIVKKPRVIIPKKFDKSSIREASRESNIPEAIIQMLCIAKNFTPLEAVRHFRESSSTIESE